MLLKDASREIDCYNTSGRAEGRVMIILIEE